MRARPPQTDWRTYLDASLFPLKLFIVLAMACMVAWRTQVQQVYPANWDFSIRIAPEANSAWDFYVFATWAALAYLVSGIVLTVGGIIQAFFSTRRAAIWSIAFAIVALIIGIWLKSCGHQGLQDITNSLVKDLS